MGVNRLETTEEERDLGVTNDHDLQAEAICPVGQGGENSSDGSGTDYQGLPLQG